MTSRTVAVLQTFGCFLFIFGTVKSSRSPQFLDDRDDDLCKEHSSKTAFRFKISKYIGNTCDLSGNNVSCSFVKPDLEDHVPLLYVWVITYGTVDRAGRLTISFSDGKLGKVKAQVTGPIKDSMTHIGPFVVKHFSPIRLTNVECVDSRGRSCRFTLSDKMVGTFSCTFYGA